MPYIKTPQELIDILTKHEDAESAILVYKEIGSILSQYDDVRGMARSMAQADLEVGGERKRTTNTGVCGWTQPKKPKLDPALWAEAKLQHPAFGTAERALEKAQDDLDELQEPFKVLPAGTFYIR